ncbi:hypothetical protein B0T17DRAFT_578452 [Bombardia bombarda]|uniref:Carrier domain-containing protein n=1 Tax=Bombardia bombarda TaxID=252184 RepID=A0AA40C4W3_9PEZI|nr:hypothetical protein B0T17DRAFT_578452 [Bombardia bombarda]
MASTAPTYTQDPVAIIGFACRLPGGNNTPHKLWDFISEGKVASNAVPASRFNIAGHYDGSHKPGTMRPLGGMFLDDVDLADFDASFFEISGTEAVAMDPNQRQMLEVVYEGLENAGISLEQINGKPVACFVGAYSSDYGDMQNRDPEDRPANNAIGVGRAIMANRISYFLNIKGPSITIDTACSGSLVGLDVACRVLQSGEVDAAIVATSNLYFNPDHVIDAGNVGQAHSPTGYCHTFDVSADGYVKAEAVSCVIVKRLSDAIRDRDPIRAIIRGLASNRHSFSSLTFGSNGRTGGIASPSAEAQAAAIRSAYANAGITNLNDTQYLECHGTGTQAGDPTEVRGAGYAFAATRDADKPLIIGSIKSNVGHSEPAAGISGLIKTVMSIETGLIPGTPLFINPSPKIDFKGNRVRASRTMIPWPDVDGKVRRASINSFGYGGANAHAIIEEAGAEARSHHVSSFSSSDDVLSLDEEEDEESARPYTLVLSANDANSLKANIQALCDHLINPRVKVSLPDLAYTLSERRSKLWHLAYVTTRSTEIEPKDFTLAKKSSDAPKIGFVFTGQGAQWPQMGKELLQFFPWTRSILEELDQVLQSIRDPPKWSLLSELTEPRSADHMRQPEFSQPLVTAIQLCLIAVLESWGITPSSVVGHSSGEIAAAYTAGFIDRASAIKAAFYRGRAAVNRKNESEANVGMLAVGLGTEAVAPFLEKYDAWIACFNSPQSLTISGRKSELKLLAEDITAAGHFARLLQVDLAYHSGLMDVIGEEYETLLSQDAKFTALDKHASSGISMFSSATAVELTGSMQTDALYWKTNMVSPVRFHEALKQMVSQPDNKSPDILIEIGPSGALAGPVSQILKSLPNGGTSVTYCASWARGVNAVKALFDTAGRLSVTGAPIDMSAVNRYKDQKVRTIIDLPNYNWNHTVKYWHENAASKDWRFRKFINHDLIGSKIFGSSWHNPTWRKHLVLEDVPWLRDHMMGPDVLIPGAGLATMAIEAMYQKYSALNPEKAIASSNDLAYRLRNVRFDRALVVEENKECVILLTLTKVPGNKDWHEFRISTSKDDAVMDHCFGLIRVQDPVEEKLGGADLAPLKNPQPFTLWYKAQREAGMGFGPSFKKVTSLEATSGQRTCRALVDLTAPKSKWDPQSYYPFHPAVLDACLQVAMPANASNERSLVKDIIVPGIVNEAIINKVPYHMREGLAIAKSGYTGRGRPDQAKSIISDISVYDPETGAMFMQVKGLNYVKIDVPPKPDPHTFDRVSWKPDVSLLTQDQLTYLAPDSQVSRSKLHSVIDLIAHKKPMLKVLEVNLDELDVSSVWFETSDMSARLAYVQYDFASPNAKTLVTVQSHNEANRHSSFHLATLENSAFGLPSGSESSLYDLAIIKAPKKPTLGLDEVLANVKPLLAEHAYTLLVHVGRRSKATIEISKDALVETRSDETEEVFEDAFPTPQSVDTPNTASSESDELSSEEAESSSLSSSESVSSASMDFVAIKESASDFWSHRRLLNLVQNTPEFVSVLELSADDSNYSYRSRPAHYLLRSGAESDDQQQVVQALPRNLVIAHIADKTPAAAGGLQKMLETSGWTVTQHRLSASSLKNPLNYPAGAVVLVLDELSNPLLVDASSRHWDALKHLLGAGHPLVWVTKGSQHVVTNPDGALVHGLFRVVRHEETGSRLTTLDVQSSTSAATLWAIDQILRLVQSGQGVEDEYVERDGVLHVQRIVPDAKVNAFKRDEADGAEPVVKSLHETEAMVQIRAERVGSLELTWCENHVGPVPVEQGFVEVEVMTVGVNFKDVATTMGIVPENEYMIGCECAGVVKRLGAGVTKFKVGDRVAVMRSGTYVNRLQAPVERVQAIPTWMSFEDAATIPLVYMTALYSLYYLADLKEGQSVLIHSAAGGVGLAAIQLAQYKKADVFVTVGTQDKREFLSSTFGIPHNRMFSSRTTKFAEEIMTETGGRGVDVILNSLTGELLDASWRIMADGGNMIEIGKRDIVDRNTLAMEPFDRNCSFRAIDLSYTKHFKDALVEKLLGEIFALVEAGHVKAISPIVTYGFENVPAALAYIRRGQHIGKIVITNHGEDVKVPIRPAIRSLQLRPDVSYLIVGGLKGLCGSVAIHLARSGAKHLIVCSRSGTEDDASARAIRSCLTYGCEVTSARGDVSDLSFVRGIFKSASHNKPIAGIIQGAMVLRDKPFETMTHQDYRESIEAKVRGTWNLHHASQEEQKQHLDFFTMLSSISGVVGNKGQANYAAANTFLDAFAHYRRQQGLPANSVDLGAIEDVGYIAEQGASYEARFDKKQWTPIGEGVLRRIVTYSILQQDVRNPINEASAAQLITGVTFPLPNDGSSDLTGEDRFGYLFNSGSNAVINDDENNHSEDDQHVKAFRLLHESGAADPSVLAKACIDLMSRQITKVLRLEVDIEPGKPLMAYGLDSLSAVELRGWIRNKLGAELSTLDITNARSLIEMCDKVVAKLPQTKEGGAKA